MCTTVATKRIPGSRNGEVRAPILPGVDVGRTGFHLRIQITDVEPEFQELKQVLLGLKVCTIFPGTLFGARKGARIAYASEVAEALELLGRSREAEIFTQRAGTFGFYVCQPKMFTYV